MSRDSCSGVTVAIFVFPWPYPMPFFCSWVFLSFCIALSGSSLDDFLKKFFVELVESSYSLYDFVEPNSCSFIEFWYQNRLRCLRLFSLRSDLFEAFA